MRFLKPEEADSVIARWATQQTKQNRTEKENLTNGQTKKQNACICMQAKMKKK